MEKSKWNQAKGDNKKHYEKASIHPLMLVINACNYAIRKLPNRYPPPTCWEVISPTGHELQGKGI